MATTTRDADRDGARWTPVETLRLHRLLMDHPDTMERAEPSSWHAKRGERQRAAGRHAIDTARDPMDLMECKMRR